MSESERYRNKKKMWLITGVVVALSVVVCLIALYFNRTSQPVMGEESSSSSSQPVEPVLPEESEEPEEPMEPDEPEEPESSQAPAPPVTSTPQVNPAPTMVTISQAGTFSTASTYRQVVITAGGVTLKNKTVTGNLFIMDTVGDGNVELENVIVNGTLYIYGGGPNTVTLRNVSAGQTLIQRDNGTVGVLATEECHLGEVTLRCDAILTEENLTEGSAGFDVLYINEGVKSPYNVTLRGVGLQRLVVNSATELSLGGGSYVGEATAQAPLHVTGSGNMGVLWVYNNSVTYETAPNRVEVSGDYDQPTHGGNSSSSASSTPKKDKDEGGSYTNPNRNQRLSMPRDLTISYRAADDSFVGSFSPVSRATGYVITPYLKKDGLSVDQPSIRLDGEGSTTAVILKDAKNYMGQELRFRVFALGDPDRNVEESEEATTPFTLISQLAAPTDLTATFNKDTNGAPRFDLQWSKVDGVRGYQVTITDQTATPPTAQQVFVEGKTAYSFPFDRTGGGARHFTFAVRALAANDTVRIDSPDSAPVTGQVTFLPEPTNLTLGLEGESFVLRWGYSDSAPAGLTANFLLTVAVDGVTEQISYPVTADKREFAIGTRDTLAGKTVRCTLRAVAGSGGGDSLGVTLSATLAADGTVTPLVQTASLGGALGGGGVPMAQVRTPVLRLTALPPKGEPANEEEGKEISASYLKTGALAIGQTLEAGARLPDGSLPAPAHPRVVYLPASEGIPAGYYAQWGGVWNSTGYEIIPSLGGVVQPPVAVPAGETQWLLLEKKDFQAGQAVSFTVLAKDGDERSPVAVCQTPGVPKKLRAPVVELEIGREGNLSVLFQAPGENPLATDYEIYPVLDGVTGEKAGSVRPGPGPDGGRLTAPFAVAGNPTQWQVPFVRVKATSPDTDCLDSDLSAPNARTWDLRVGMAYRQPEGQPAYCFFKLPKGYSGPYNFALMDVTDPANPQVIYSTTTRGNPLQLVPGEEMSFGWCPHESPVGKRARIVLTAASEGENFTFGTRDFIIQ